MKIAVHPYDAVRRDLLLDLRQRRPVELHHENTTVRTWLRGGSSHSCTAYICLLASLCLSSSLVEPVILFVFDVSIPAPSVPPSVFLRWSSPRARRLLTPQLRKIMAESKASHGKMRPTWRSKESDRDFTGTLASSPCWVSPRRVCISVHRW
jgi:hypothetical protein